MLGPFTTASCLTAIHQVSPAVLSRAACASMSTTPRQRRRRQRQRVTEGTAMAPWNGPNKKYLKKCWAHSPLRADARPNFALSFTRCRYCRTPPLSHAACTSMSTTTTTTTTTRGRGDRYGPIEWAQSINLFAIKGHRH